MGGKLPRRYTSTSYVNLWAQKQTSFSQILINTNDDSTSKSIWLLFQDGWNSATNATSLKGVRNIRQRLRQTGRSHAIGADSRVEIWPSLMIKTKMVQLVLSQYECYLTVWCHFNFVISILWYAVYIWFCCHVWCVDHSLSSDYVASYLRDLLNPVWIGLSDRLHEGKFAWSDGVSAVLYTNWADKEPNNVDGQVRNQWFVDILWDVREKFFIHYIWINCYS